MGEINQQRLEQVERTLYQHIEISKEAMIKLIDELAQLTVPLVSAAEELGRNLQSIQKVDLEKSFEQTLQEASYIMDTYSSKHCEITFWGMLIPFSIWDVAKYEMLQNDSAAREKYVGELYVKKLCEDGSFYESNDCLETLIKPSML